ncbi:YbjO family protein [Erwinia sp. JUb26]|uniref:YbjO family protein n=1 Tax=Erwinia sp. JUb26 TaxID=2485126 RepID=UPI000F4A2DCF|nr:YbjO family protein [Erwinia sp. JUb26]ROR11223.1 uncharacterized protein DUF2593 [Erwinia sp. JUb26]
MSEVFRGGSALSDERMAIPVPVLIAGSAIIATRVLSVLLLANELGYEEVINFIHRSAQSWDSTLIFIVSQLIFFLELRCAIALMRGRNWGRWTFFATQVVVLLYMMVATLTGIYPEIFSISGENNAHIIGSLIAQKFPDMLILLLLFVPLSSRHYYR